MLIIAFFLFCLVPFGCEQQALHAENPFQKKKNCMVELKAKL